MVITKHFCCCCCWCFDVTTQLMSVITFLRLYRSMEFTDHTHTFFTPFFRTNQNSLVSPNGEHLLSGVYFLRYTWFDADEDSCLIWPIQTKLFVLILLLQWARIQCSYARQLMRLDAPQLDRCQSHHESTPYILLKSREEQKIVRNEMKKDSFFVLFHKL